MMGLLLGAFTLVLAGLYMRFRPGWRKTGPYLPDSFVAGLGLFAVGAVINAVQMRSAAADEVALMGWLALSSSLVGAIAGSISYRMPGTFAAYVEEANRSARPAERLIVGVGLGICSLVCLWFIYAVFSSGSVGALLSVRSLVDDASSLTSARKMITAGTEGYFAPGYVKQFRDILVPILLSAMLALNRRAHKAIPFWVVVAITLAAMLVTGQRSILMILIATLLLAANYTVGLRRRTLVIAGSLALLVFGVLTVMLGRLTQDAGTLEAVGAVAESLGNRVFVAPPYENTVTQPVWKSLGPTMGGSWMEDLLGSFSDKSSLRLSSRLHAETGGSEEGNSPLAFATDVWLAWGWPGLMLVPLVFAMCLAALDRLLLSRASAITFGVKLYLALVIPLFYSPYLFVLYGGVVAIVLLCTVIVLRRRRRWSRLYPGRVTFSGGAR